jgi:hypothetical protein
LEPDAAYFGRRADQERRAAINASNRSARLAHLEMAARYDDLTQAFASPEPAKRVLKMSLERQ